MTLRAFREDGFQQPIVSSSEYNSSPALGISGEKEGPYDWVPPAYWYDSSHSSHNRFDNDPTLTNVGGSWGFDSEQSAGDTVPTIDSINRFMSPEEQALLWQDPAYNQYHTNYEAPYKGYAFGTLHALDTALAARYGQWHSLGQYVQEAQVQNYEVTRSQYEAFIDHSTKTPTPSTGTFYWMANKGWPSLLWDLYNYDYDQAGTYFGAQEANIGVHGLYTYDTHTVTLDNLSGRSLADLTVESKVHDVAGAVIDDQRSAAVSLSPQQVRNDILAPHVPASTEAPTPASAYFVELIVRQRGNVIHRNVYWLSTQADVVDWPATAGRPRATMSQYADLHALSSLPPANIEVRSQSHVQPGGQTVTTVTLRNQTATPTVGFFLRADLRRGDPSGRPLAGDNELRPVTWSANDVTLWPGESETLTATYPTDFLRGATRLSVPVAGTWPRPPWSAWQAERHGQLTPTDFGRTYTTPIGRHERDTREATVASLAALLDQLYEGDIVDTADVARVSGSHPRSVARWQSPEGAPRRDSEERLLELKAVVDLLRRVVREDAARLWLRAPNPELAYEKPLDLIGAGRYQRVIDLLLAMAEGVTA